MSILRNKIKSDFSQIPNNLITDSRLSHGAKLVAIYLMSKPDGWQVLNADIMKNLNISKPHTIAGYWRELIASGWVLRIPRKDDGSKFLGGFDYEIIGFLLTETEMPENRNAENGHCGKTEMPKMGIHNNTEYINNTDLDNNTDLKPPIIPPHKKSAHSTAFEQFWSAYPRKQDKGRAWSSWKRQKLDLRLCEILNAVGIWSRCAAWENPQFIPHAATWLNNQRFTPEALQDAMRTTVESMNAFDLAMMRVAADEKRESQQTQEAIAHEPSPQF